MGRRAPGEAARGSRQTHRSFFASFRAACTAWLKGFGSCSPREGTGPLLSILLKYHPGYPTGPLQAILSNPKRAPAVLSSNDAPGRGWDHVSQDSPAAGSSCSRQKTSVPSVRGGSELCPAPASGPKAPKASQKRPQHRPRGGAGPQPAGQLGPHPKEAVRQRQVTCVLPGRPLAQAASCQPVAAVTALSFAKQAASG